MNTQVDEQYTQGVKNQVEGTKKVISALEVTFNHTRTRAHAMQLILAIFVFLTLLLAGISPQVAIMIGLSVFILQIAIEATLEWLVAMIVFYKTISK